MLNFAQSGPYRTAVGHFRRLKGLDSLGALALAVETFGFHRFERAPADMSLAALVSSERTNGG